MASNKGVWTKNGETITGTWSYNWSGDYFWIQLDSRCPIRGCLIEFRCHTEYPEFNGWKLVKEKEKVDDLPSVATYSG